MPTLTVGGYYDQEDMWGAQEEYAALENNDKNHSNFLVLGPWYHGQWQGTTRRLAALDWHTPTTDEFRVQFEAPFFAKYLKGETGFNLEDVASFQTGSNTWRRYRHWPPAEAKSQELFLQPDGTLATWAPVAQPAKQFVTYESDPANPVPYVLRPASGEGGEASHWRTWMAEDQRFVTSRKDVVKWQTDARKSDFTLTGEVLADVFASTSGSDADWVVKLIDVYPDDASEGDLRGYQLMTNAEIFRGRYRKSFSSPEPIPSGAVQEYKWSLHGIDHVFKAGHRMMVTVQSTWFPLYDRNPQTFVPNIMLAQPGDFRLATQRIYTSGSYPSHIVVPIATDASATGNR